MIILFNNHLYPIIIFYDLYHHYLIYILNTNLMQLNVLIINDPLNIFQVYLHVDLLDFINFYVLLHPILIHYHYHFLLQLIFMLYYILLYLYLLDVLLFILFLNVDFYKIITINKQMSLNDLFNILLMVYLFIINLFTYSSNN